MKVGRLLEILSQLDPYQDIYYDDPESGPTRIQVFQENDDVYIIGDYALPKGVKVLSNPEED
jgi:hypothetical protein